MKCHLLTCDYMPGEVYHMPGDREEKLDARGIVRANRFVVSHFVSAFSTPVSHITQ